MTRFSPFSSSGSFPWLLAAAVALAAGLGCGTKVDYHPAESAAAAESASGLNEAPRFVGGESADSADSEPPLDPNQELLPTPQKPDAASEPIPEPRPFSQSEPGPEPAPTAVAQSNPPDSAIDDEPRELGIEDIFNPAPTTAAGDEPGDVDDEPEPTLASGASAGSDSLPPWRAPSTPSSNGSNNATINALFGGLKDTESGAPDSPQPQAIASRVPDKLESIDDLFPDEQEPEEQGPAEQQPEEQALEPEPEPKPEPKAPTPKPATETPRVAAASTENYFDDVDPFELPFPEPEPEQPTEPDPTPDEPPQEFSDPPQQDNRPATPINIDNTRHLAWLLGSKISFSSLSHLMESTPSSDDDWQLAAIAELLTISTPIDLAEATAGAEYARAISAMLAETRRLASEVGPLHGDDHAALVEVAVKSNALVLLYEKNQQLAEPVKRAVQAAAERAEIPQDVWRPLIDLLDGSPTVDEVRAEVFRLHGEVELALRSPAD